MMEYTVDKNKLADAIINDTERKQFLRLMNGKQFPGGIQIKFYDRWTSKQQGKLWRDIQEAAKMLDWTSRKMYAVLITSEPTRDLFHERQIIPWGKKTKEVEIEKTFSQWSKQDVIEGMDIILEFMEYLLQMAYQEKIVFNWSSRENKESKKKMFEFTGKPYIIKE